MYQKEELIYSGRPTYWTGKVALMYPSDFGFAVGETIRSTCLGKNLYNYSSDSCYNNIWIESNSDQWFLTHLTGFKSMSYETHYGRLGIYDTYQSVNVYPVVYLNSSVSISDGNGSTQSPYILG